MGTKLGELTFRDDTSSNTKPEELSDSASEEAYPDPALVSSQSELVSTISSTNEMQIFTFGKPDGDNFTDCCSENSSPGGARTMGVCSGGAIRSARLKDVVPAFTVGEFGEVVIISVAME
eukprot:CAMPEP_0169210610 /NCGR_PEP_ID=MMETSP1016-20121227/15310_1 /TAXON_ID=342587 /ORGANISM="Karlodinium micrum, Strain CCMP2283" /LENGTH=119 /DNA_ID=CAMNT_0009288169 /DNA_START=296 /DNA_END=652 /DNA_ORIENTATION=+